MSQKTKHCYDNCLLKTINQTRIYLYRSWDLTHGIGWFCHTYGINHKTGFGFHKKNRFTAVRQALTFKY